MSEACKPYAFCDASEPDAVDAPRLLSETGLFEAGSAERVSADVLSYEPRFGLWSDGANKRRFMRLPAGEAIDTGDLDDWRFPRGTKLWKEFSLGAVRLETRLLHKVGDGDDEWVMLSYVWTDDQRDAVAAPYGAFDVLGTPHNVPAASECQACHAGRHSRVLGVSFIQLKAQDAEHAASLESLEAQGLTSTAVAMDNGLPGSPEAQAALGYMHANCGHCHNHERPRRDGARCFDPENSLELHLHQSEVGAVGRTGAYRTAVGHFAMPGHPDHSALLDVFERKDASPMPPLGTERVDPQGRAVLRAWIESL